MIDLPTESEPVVVIQGDCLDVLRELPDGCVDAVVTDPPYGVGLVTKSNDCRGLTFDRGESLRASTLYEDDPESVAELVRQFMPEALRVANRALIFSGQNMVHEYPKPTAMGCVYLSNGAGRCAWGFQCFQPILYYGQDPYMQRGLGGRPNSFRTEQMNRDKFDHPCPKPLDWMKWAVRRVSLSSDIILDPFAGSGTTGVAAILEGRRCILIEKEPKYVEICRRRIAEAMGRAPNQLPFERADLFSEAVA